MKHIKLFEQFEASFNEASLRNKKMVLGFDDAYAYSNAIRKILDSDDIVSEFEEDPKKFELTFDDEDDYDTAARILIRNRIDYITKAKR